MLFLKKNLFLYLLFIGISYTLMLNYALSAPSQGTQMGRIIGQFNEASCTLGDSCTDCGKRNVCLAVGFTKNQDQLYPLIVNTDYRGKNFQRVNAFGNTQTGTLLTASCATARLDYPICIAGGYLGDNKETGVPLLMQSIDGGNTWTQAKVTGLPKFGLIKKVSCTTYEGESNARITCVAVGWGSDSQSSDKRPILVQNVGGDCACKWVNRFDHVSEVAKGKLTSVSCTGYDDRDADIHSMCVAIGENTTQTVTQPLLIQSNDGGNAWVSKKLSKVDRKATLTNVNCTGGSDNALCMVVGKLTTQGEVGQPIAYQTKDWGASWVKSSIENFPVDWDGTVNGVSCAGSCSHAFCAMVTSGSKTNLFPMAYAWKNKTRNQWLKATIYNASADWYTLQATTCLETVGSKTNDCFAAGFANNNGVTRPILAASANTLSTWEAIETADLPKQGVLRSTTCTDTGSMCLAVGYSTSITTDEPLIMASLDRGKHWVRKAIVPLSNAYHVCDPQSQHCVAVIKGSKNHEAYYSKDNGNTWMDAHIDEGPSRDDLYSEFSDLACGANVQNCVAVGSEGIYQHVALALKTTNGGLNWQYTFFEGPCAGPRSEGNAVFESVTCDINGLNCIAKGWCSVIGGRKIDFSVLV